MPKVGSRTKPTASRVRSSTSTRQLRAPEYKSFRLSKRITSSRPAIKGSFRLFIASIRLLLRNWRIFGGILAIYVVLLLVLVRGLNSFADFTPVKEAVFSFFTGGVDKAIGGLVLFTSLVTGTGEGMDGSASAYQVMLAIIISLVVIWALRQRVAGAAIRVRDAFYNGMYPFVQFILVLLMIGLQLSPLIAVNFFLGAVFTEGFAVTAPEKVAWSALLALLALWPIYMVSSSIFALYVVTLEGMTPLQALRSSRGLVQYRRWTVLRRVMFLPIAILALGAFIMLPVIMFLTVLTEWIYFVISAAAVMVVHSYMYLLYRELMKDE